MKIGVFIFILSLMIVSCSGTESHNNLNWKTYAYKDAGIKAKFPCKPKESVERVQETPRPIHIYSYDCETDGMSFLISSQHYLDEFNEESISKSFKAVEFGHKEFGMDMKEVSQKVITIYPNAEAKLYRLEDGNGSVLLHLAIANKTFQYSVMSRLWSEKKKKDLTIEQFDKATKKFIDSFEIILDE